jgi:hypothetical protein
MFESIGVKLSTFREDMALRYAAKYLPDSQLQFHGLVTCDHYRNKELIHTQCGSNIFTLEGRAKILNCIFRGVATDAKIYVGIYKLDVTPLETHIAGTGSASGQLGTSGTYGECLDADYDSPATNKPEYVIASVASNANPMLCTNTASKATFVMAQGITVYGAFLSNVASKTSPTGGTLFCAKKFTSSRAVIADDELAITYVITTTSS